ESLAEPDPGALPGVAVDVGASPIAPPVPRLTTPHGPRAAGDCRRSSPRAALPRRLALGAGRAAPVSATGPGSPPDVTPPTGPARRLRHLRRTAPSGSRRRAHARATAGATQPRAPGGTRLHPGDHPPVRHHGGPGRIRCSARPRDQPHREGEEPVE